MTSDVEKYAEIGPNWCTLCDLGNGLYLMMRHLTQAAEFSIMIRRDFPLLQPHCQVEAELLNLQYPDPSKIADTAVRLRWYRHRKALLQSQVAEYAGIHRSTYINFEEGRDYYPVDKLEKIAQILEVDPEDLMDDYNLFLYHNQGEQIRARREALGMTVPQYAKHLGVPVGKLRNWESNRVQIFKSTWEKYFK